MSLINQLLYKKGSKRWKALRWSVPLITLKNTYDGENISLYNLLCYKGKKGKGYEQSEEEPDNQAIGLVPLLLFMFLDNYFSYLLSFIIGVTFLFRLYFFVSDTE